MVDALCFDDLDEFGREIDDPIAEFEQDFIHVLIEPAGSNLDDEDRGIGITEELSGSNAATMGARIDGEMLKDDRVGAARSTLSPNTDDTFRIGIEVALSEETLGIQFDVGPDGSVRKAQ